jgi:hypothetical protein
LSSLKVKLFNNFVETLAVNKNEKRNNVFESMNIYADEDITYFEKLSFC